MQTCAACHTVGGGKLVGPDLLGVENRHSEDWLRKFIKSSQSLIASGDEEAIKVFNENFMIPMPDQLLSDEEITAVLDYIQGSDEQSASVAELTTDQKNTEDTGNREPVELEKNDFIYTVLFNPLLWMVSGVIGFLLLIIVIYARIIKNLTELVSDNKRGPDNSR